MEEKIKSDGKCLFCGKTFAKAGINRHLKTHLTEKAQAGKPGKSFLVKVEQNPRYGNAPYFLSLWIDGNAKMQDLDNFLRDIWLECCGHMSQFRLQGVRNPGYGMPMNINSLLKSLSMPQSGEYGEIAMNRKVNTVFSENLKLEYEYDFGSTTELLLTVLEEYPVKAEKKIVLLSRNEPLKWLCHTCKKEPATEICTVHDWEEDQMFCGKCAEKHAKECPDFEDYAAMPVVNSPRMGVCAYEGGSIDTERD